VLVTVVNPTNSENLTLSTGRLIWKCWSQWHIFSYPILPSSHIEIKIISRPKSATSYGSICWSRHGYSP